MADVHTPEVRSYNMSKIRGKDTKPELLVRKFLFANGLRYRINYRKLPGRPDIVFPGLKKVIFVHGCFWHGHEDCRYYVVPKTRTKWWLEKIGSNKQRDLDNQTKLRGDGWEILTIFECDLKSEKRTKTLNRALKFINKK